MKSIFLSGVIQGVLLAFLLLVRGKEHRPNRVLGVLMFIVSIHLFLIMFEGTDFFTSYPHFTRITWLLPALYGPLMLLFTMMVTQRRQVFVKTDLLVFVPFSIYLLLLLPYYLSSAAQKLIYMTNDSGMYADDFGILNQSLNFFHIGFISVAITIYHKNLTKWKETYSGTEITRLHWLLNYLYITLAIVVLSIFIFYAKKYSIGLMSQIYPYHFLGIVVLIYWIGYRVLFQPEIFKLSVSVPSGEPVILEETRYDSFSINEESAMAIEHKIRQAMENRSPFSESGFVIGSAITAHWEFPPSYFTSVKCIYGNELL
ncbi:MAG: hypothetical protein U5K79_26010 [Cyclobacteriaceae bacterium]|nr:hypothetical protein [Cyclobacteriaceae bacterium]